MRVLLQAMKLSLWGVKRRANLVLLILFFITIPSYGWNMVGHMVVANIAYDQLTPTAKRKVNAITKVVGKYYPSSNTFVRSAAWPDWIKSEVSVYNQWHYIDTPWITDKTISPSAVEHENIIWAIQQSEAIVENPKSNPLQKSIYLRFLIHFVGDIHQPLHTIEHYSAKFPKGDRGGNDVPIKSYDANNLHALWDNGMGEFSYHRVKNHSLNQKVKLLSHKIEQQYPKSYFADKYMNQDPQQWANESYRLAIKYSYDIRSGESPSSIYLNQGQIICEQQLALAGYRLGYVLNQIFR
jgi:hypothetical protein